MAAVLGAATVAAACTPAEDDDGARAEQGVITTTVAPPVQPTSPRRPPPPTDTPAPEPEITTIEQLQEAWAEQRAAVVAEIVTQGYGVGPDNVLRGPSGFEVDLNQCPDDWSPTEGVTDDSITVGMTAALSGTLIAWGNLPAGIMAYLDMINEEGGIGGRNIELIVRDDSYVAEYTIEMVEELLTDEDVFALTNLGLPTGLAVYDRLNQACVPQPFVISFGHPAFGDPVNHPFTTGLTLSMNTEARLWRWIETTLTDELPVSVAALVMDNEFGSVYEQAFGAWADANPHVVAQFDPVRHDPAAPNVAAPMDAVAALDPDVFIAMTAGNPCLLAVEESARTGLTASAHARFLPTWCQDPNAYLVPAGKAADGWRVADGGLETGAAITGLGHTAPDDDPYHQFISNQLTAVGLDPSLNLFRTGFGLYGWAHVEALRIADALPGGLTRPNYLLALRTMDGHHPASHDGIRFATDGNADADFFEGTAFAVYDAAEEGWILDGDVVDLNGATPPCAWDGNQCR